MYFYAAYVVMYDLLQMSFKSGRSDLGQRFCLLRASVW